MDFILSSQVLESLCKLNHFPLNISPNEMVFFGLRGCLPKNLNDESYGLAAQHQLELTTIDYESPRCTIGQWIPSQKTIAVFPGSTVPNKKYMTQQMGNFVERIANQMMTGFYRQVYQQGIHRGSDGFHPAFVQVKPVALQRSRDDLDYDEFDALEVGNVSDNLHATRRLNIAETYYSSAGCQVVVGNSTGPTLTSTAGPWTETGPWQIFRTRAYAWQPTPNSSPQTQYSYLLLPAQAAASISSAPTSPRSPLLRYGSQGEPVKVLQNRLGVSTDGDFGGMTLRAVFDYQKNHPALSADGVVGPSTASALGFSLPLFS